MDTEGWIVITSPCHKLRLESAVSDLNIVHCTLLCSYFCLSSFSHIHLSLYEINLALRWFLGYGNWGSIKSIQVTISVLNIVVYVKLLHSKCFRLECFIRMCEYFLLYVKIQ